MRRSRKYFAEKMKHIQEYEYCYVPQKNEVITQCSEEYPSYWFISNMGYLFSVLFKEIKILKPNPTPTGKKNADGERSGIDWFYKTGDQTKVPMQRIVAEHFLEYTDEDRENGIELHHIQKRKSFTKNQPQFCNRADNLQLLPTDIHRRATYYGQHTEEEIDKKLQEKIEKSGCDIYAFGDLTKALFDAINDQSLESIAYQTNGETDILNRTVKALRLTGMEYIED